MAQQLSRRSAAVLVLGTSLWLGGCGLVKDNTQPPPTPFRGTVEVRTRQIGTFSPPREGKLGGVDYALVHYLMWNGRITLLVWTDNESGDYQGTSEQPRSEGAEGVFDYALGKVEVKYRTADGTTGSLNVAGQELDLAKGWLVLVSTAGGQTRVKQLQRAELKAQPDIKGGNAKDFESLKTDPEVMTFYGVKK